MRSDLQQINCCDNYSRIRGVRTADASACGRRSAGVFVSADGFFSECCGRGLTRITISQHEMDVTRARGGFHGGQWLITVQLP